MSVWAPFEFRQSRDAKRIVCAASKNHMFLSDKLCKSKFIFAEQTKSNIALENNVMYKDLKTYYYMVLFTCITDNWHVFKLRAYFQVMEKIAQTN